MNTFSSEDIFWTTFSIALLLIFVVAFFVRTSTENKLYAETARIAKADEAARGGTPRQSGSAWELEKARIIDEVIGPKFGSNGRRIVRQTSVRRKIEAILDGAEI